jgi:hypothetical protein
MVPWGFSMSWVGPLFSVLSLGFFHSNQPRNRSRYLSRQPCANPVEQDMNIIDSVKNILLTPKTEWPVIAGESTTVASLYTNYIVILAAIPAVASFIGASLTGRGGFGVTVRAPIMAGLVGAVLQYALSLGLIYVMALIVDALAPTFGARKNPIQALKTVTYSWTASAIAGLGALVPWLGGLIGLAGGIYSIYLLYLALPVTMQCRLEKTVGYMTVSIICALVLGLVVMSVVGVFTGADLMMSDAFFPG